MIRCPKDHIFPLAIKILLLLSYLLGLVSLSALIAIRQGLAMPLKERKARWEAQFDNVKTNDVDRWRDNFVSCLRAIDIDVFPERASTAETVSP